METSIKMKIERSKNASRNIFFGVILNIYNIVLPFVMRTVMIYLLGVEYLGLNSLFTSILQVLNLAELGVGSAMTFSMYKPIAENDEDKICALMKLYKIYYRVIGGLVLTGGLIVLPFMPKLISGNIPADINIYALYMLNLLATVLTYWLFAYRNSLLSAYQRNDLISKITLFTNTCKYIAQILVLYLFKNYYYYVIAILVTQILNNIITAIVSKKRYPQYSPKGNLQSEEKKKINARVRDLFTSKLGGTIVDSADTIVISSFLGLRVLAIYQNYFYILTAVMGFFTILYSSVLAGVGNSMVTETKEKNYGDLKKMTFIIFWFIGFSCCGMSSLYQPVMELWVGQDLMLDSQMVPLFCLYFVGKEIVCRLSVYTDGMGIWHQDRFRPLISGVANLILNLMLVNIIGIYGILLSTIISVFCISIPWLVHNVFTYIFDINLLKNYLKHLAFYIRIVIGSMVLTFITCNFNLVNGFQEFVLKFLIVCIIPNLIYLLVYCRTEEFHYAIGFVKNNTKRGRKYS